MIDACNAAARLGIASFLLAVSGGAAATTKHHHSARAALVAGVINPAVTQANIDQTICVSGWTKTVRPAASYTTTLKQQQMVKFGLKGSPHDYEEDHLISLEVGGNPTDPDNLWPQSWTGPRNAHKKDRLENLIHRLVCSKTITLAQGRRELSKNWVAAYRNRIGPMP